MVIARANCSGTAVESQSDLSCNQRVRHDSSLIYMSVVRRRDECEVLATTAADDEDDDDDDVNAAALPA